MAGVIFESLGVMVVGYVLGSIPTAYLVARWRKGIDIREVGSRNMGTMNTFRNVGLLEALLVLLVDGGKGIAAVLMARIAGLPPLVEALAGAAAIAGHDFPIFLRFRGGMGGATGMAVLLFLMPWAMPFYFGLTAGLFAATRNLTVSYGIAFLVFPFVSWLIYHSTPYLAFSLAVDLSLFLYNIPRISAIRRHGVRDPGFRRKG